MKKLVVGILVACICLVTTTAFAEGPYFSASLGVFMPNDSDVTDPVLTSEGLFGAEFSYDTGYSIALALGKDLDTVRVEGEVSYKAADIDELSASDFAGNSGSMSVNGDISSLSLMANVWKDINVGAVTPYIGVGLGVAKVDGELEGESESDTVFAYQAGLGLGINLQENLILDISYRYFATSDPDFDGTKLDFSSNNFMAGLRVNY